MRKIIVFVFLSMFAVSSCGTGANSSSYPNPAVATSIYTSVVLSPSPTNVIETTVIETQVIIPAITSSPQSPTPVSPSPTAFFTFSVDRHDPESVMRAYFDAWARSDSFAVSSLLRPDYGQQIHFEPINSINILEIKLTEESPAHRTYSVLYDVQWQDPGVYGGQKRMDFYLTSYTYCNSWIITNHGVG